MDNVTGTSQRIFAVGDIHGDFDKLSRLMERLPFDGENDILVFIGDYINRGPRSADVISYLIDLKTHVKNIYLLMGNHEHALINYAKGNDKSLLQVLRHMEIDSTLGSYGTSSPHSISGLSFLPEDHRSFLTGLLPYYRTADYLFVHAGLIPGKSLEEHTLESLVNVRNIFLSDEEERGFVTVFGHTSFETPLVTPTKIGIDTGVSNGNMLTAVELPHLRFFHA